MVNLTDPQLVTVAAFRRALEERGLPFFHVLNKSDLVDVRRIDDVVKRISGDIILASMRTRRSLGEIKRRLAKLPQGSRIVVLASSIRASQA